MGHEDQSLPESGFAWSGDAVNDDVRCMATSLYIGLRDLMGGPFGLNTMGAGVIPTRRMSRISMSLSFMRKSLRKGT